MFIRVLLPAPFSPKSMWISPANKSKFTLSFARTLGNFLVIPLRLTNLPGLTSLWCSVSGVSDEAATVTIYASFAYGRARALGGLALEPKIAIRKIVAKYGNMAKNSYGMNRNELSIVM
jgi:hypothetical protein